MSRNIFERSALVAAMAATLVVGLGAQRGRTANDRSTRDDDQANDRNAVSETVTKTIPLPSNGRLKLRTFSGYVHITGTNSRDVTIKAVRRADRDVLDHVRLTIDTSGSTVSINANDKDREWDRNSRDGDKVVRTDFDIDVPASASLDINGFSSPVEIGGVTGDQRLETFNGHIVVKGGKGAVNAHSFNGEIDVDLTPAGAHPELTANTFDGRIRAHIAESAHAEVQFNSFSGEFNSDIPLTMRSAHRGKVSGRTDSKSDASTSTLKFETFSGDVQVVK